MPIISGLDRKITNVLLVAVLVASVAVAVNAYGTSNPSAFGHSAGEVEGTIPSGFCIFSDSITSCPSGWTRDTSFDGRTIYGSSSPGSSGGSSTHTHTTAAHALTISEIPSHTHVYQTGYQSAVTRIDSNGAFGGGTPDDTSYRYYTESTGGGDAHSHGNTGSTSSWPPYRTVIVCCKN